jgi:hypothetical protein
VSPFFRRPKFSRRSRYEPHLNYWRYWLLTPIWIQTLKRFPATTHLPLAHKSAFTSLRAPNTIAAHRPPPQQTFPISQLFAFHPRMASQPTFTVFQDVQTTSTQVSVSVPPSNSRLTASASLPTSSRPPKRKKPKTLSCSKCQRTKSIGEFYKGALAEVDINALASENLSPNCRTCREKLQIQSQKRNEKRRQKADEEKRLHIKTATWASQDVQELFVQE